MKNVGCNRKEDVGQGEDFPEWMIDGFHSSLITSNVECMDIAVDQFIDVKE